jgi:hypothetical protein
MSVSTLPPRLPTSLPRERGFMELLESPYGQCWAPPEPQRRPLAPPALTAQPALNREYPR